VYTALTRGRRLVTVVGQRQALGLAIRQTRADQRYSGLLARLRAV
jgi:exodeoxyribonuclease V alpha subunit